MSSELSFTRTDESHVGSALCLGFIFCRFHPEIDLMLFDGEREREREREKKKNEAEKSERMCVRERARERKSADQSTFEYV